MLSQSPLACDCADVELGSHDNAVMLYPPPALRITRVPVTVDRCIAEEVQHLWELGIVTTGNCCGHNGKAPPVISVATEFIPQMKHLGYRECYNPCRPDAEDSFIPRSLRLRRYADGERPYAVCYDCRRHYSTFPDLLVPTAVWEVINPTYHEGAGLLCPTCISNRCEVAGFRHVPCAFASGPLVCTAYRDRRDGEDGLAFLDTLWKERSA